ncbi:MAG: chromosomal replication initiator protein DnaA [Acidobacteria bacterium]|nr:MAG: chromosomal replication initiator protein DnaA [Acidobacteriota bacterium]
MDAWQQILKFVESKINRQNFITWFKPTQFQSLDENNNLFVKVPNQVFEDWLSRHYSNLLHEAIEHANLGSIKICFHVEGNSQPKKEVPQSATPYQTTLNFDSVEFLLNPKYTFDRFVVASCNQFAHAAALAVAESPSKAYNPLFIYGGVGLGKTHLMQAVGHKIKERDRRVQLSYVSSEKFTNEVINAIRYDKTLALREKYRSVDVLLIDDIQFISGKEATQEEFFHTFNALYDAQKQIVLSSDSLPKEIPSIEERLQSRFESGLIADIQPPDLETKVAILKKKAESENFEIPDNVAFYVASKIKSNIRELEGSLVRLMAFSSLQGEKVSLGMAQEVLKHILKSQEKHISIEQIQRTVAEYFNLKVSELKSKNNAKIIAQPRQLGMYLCRQLTGASLPEIGREFGGKHHTTVLHSIKKVEQARKSNKDFNSLINMFLDSFQ